MEVELDWDNFDEAFDSLEAEITNIVRGITVEVWNLILVRTPQFEGRMVASYTYSLNKPVFIDRSMEISPVDEEGNAAADHRRTFRAGSTTAINLANLESLGADGKFRLGDTVFISNGVDHGEGPYSQAIEDGDIVLRSVNRPGRPARRALDWIAARYGVEVAPSRVTYLKNLSIGI